jgi:hypothetical protein
MAEFWAYVPEPEELELLARVGMPEGVPSRDLRTRKNVLVGSFVFMQAHAHRWITDRYVRRAEALDCAGGQEWVIEALCTPLPNRPPLLHAGCTPCPFEGCLDPCLGDECVCSDPAAAAAADLRICVIEE